MKFKLFFLLLCILSSANLFAQSHGNEIGAQTDNDSYLFQGSDRYYTDGIFIYFRHALSVNSNTLQNKVLGFEAGQKIFNPQSGSITDINGVEKPSLIDRPFAGYLYFGSTLNFLYKNESNLKLGIQVGVIGPASKAQQIQTWVHNNFGFYPPAGWEYQIQNNAVVNLSAEYNRLITRSESLDLSLTSYGNLGTGFTGAGIGPMVRLGNFNQLFHSVSTQSTAIKNNEATSLHKNEVFFYYKPQFNYVAYDATIQGGLSKNNAPNSMEKTLDKEPFIFSNRVGFAFTTARFVFDIAAIFHTKDDKEMVQAHQWGSVTGLYRFR